MLMVMAEDLSVTPALALGGTWEPHVGTLLRDLLRPGQVVVEGGANLGYHTVMMAARIGPSGVLHAFEPVPDFWPLLEANTVNNGVADRVRLHPAALLETPRTIEIVQDPAFGGSGAVATEEVGARYARRIAAEATTLDAVLRDGRPVDLIRLDVEGTEMLALRGAAAVLQRSPTLRIVMEWSPPMLAKRGDLAGEVAWLAGQGFRFWRIQPRMALFTRHRLEEVTAGDLPGLPHGDLLASRQDPP